MKSWRDWIGVELSAVSGREKFISVLGGFASILALFFINDRMFVNPCPLLGSMGASAVLLFAVPHGQLSQPWPVIAGHVFSALIGVACAGLIANTALAAACAVGLAIGVMHQFKCIHPPGGATALIAVLGGPAVRALGVKFALIPVLLSAVAIVAIAIVFNSMFSWRRYPASFSHTASTALAPASAPTHQEVVEAIRSIDSFVDITEEDLLRLSEALRAQRAARRPARGRRSSRRSAPAPEAD